jgi:imidazolonepropionase-like amidohydrolase
MVHDLHVPTVSCRHFADLLLVDGNPLENINLIADPSKDFLVIMKDGKVYKNTLTR